MSVIERLLQDDEDEDESGEDGAAPSQRLCVDCKAAAPFTKTAHTLISSKHGWRLERIARDDGKYQFDWRCPKCWMSHRRSAPKP